MRAVAACVIAGGMTGGMGAAMAVSAPHIASATPTNMSTDLTSSLLQQWLSGTTSSSREATIGSAGQPARDPVGGPRMGDIGLVMDLPEGVPAPPAFPAGCYLIADLDTRDVILAKCPHTQGLPASTIKALTALALVDRLAPTDAVAAVEEDAAQDGTKVGMKPGSSYTVEQLFQAMLMASGNDAAWALARFHGVPQTVDAMNETAAWLGAHDTVARNPSGLDAQGQVTSVYDLALIGRAVLANPRLAQYVTTPRVVFPDARVPGGGKRGSYEITNHNRLLPNYPGTIGVKNGYTVKARATYIGAARRGDQAYIITYLNNPAGGWRPTAAMLDWAFANGKRARPVGTLVDPGTTHESAPMDQSPEPAAAAGGDRDRGAPPLAALDAPDAQASVFGQPHIDWLITHPDVLLFAGGTLAVAAAGLGLSARARQE